MTADDASPDAAAVAEVPALAAGSRILEQAARRRAVPVHRLSATLVRCDAAGGGMIFHGLVGASCGRSTEVLSTSAAWLRAYLSGHGLPVVTSRLLDAGAEELVDAAAAALGFPIRLRPATAEQPRFDMDGPDGVATAWRALTEVLEPRSQVILEPVPTGVEFELAVVEGQVVAATPEAVPAPEITDLAVRAVGLLPGARYASVVVRVTDAGARIDRVDPLLQRWPLHPEPASRIADAILDTELG